MYVFTAINFPLSPALGVMYFYLLNMVILPVEECGFCLLCAPSHASSLSYSGETSCQPVTWPLVVKQGQGEDSDPQLMRN